MESSLEIPTSLTNRIRAEYVEAPGLRLTVAQAARFWGLDSQVCEQLLRKLEQAGFLGRCPDGSYRHSSGR
jgi:hypothetical protein